MSQQSPILIAIADDHQLVLESMAEAVNRFNGFKVIITAGNGQELIDKIEQVPVKPNICILDVNMPVLNGYESVTIIKKRWPEVKVLTISMYDDDYAVIHMLQKGADGYIAKGDNLNEVQKALTSIYKYGYHYSRLANKDLFKSAKETILPKLTDREKEYLKLVCTDITTHKIAKKMAISSRSVEYYRDTLYRKLNVQTRAGLVMFVIETGIIPID